MGNKWRIFYAIVHDLRVEYVHTRQKDEQMCTIKEDHIRTSKITIV